MSQPSCFEDEKAAPVIERVCAEQNIDVELLRELCSLVDRYAGSGRAQGITVDIQTVLDKFLDRSAAKGEAESGEEA